MKFWIFELHDLIFFEMPVVQWHQTGQKVAGCSLQVYLVKHVIKISDKISELVVGSGEAGGTKVRHEHVGTRMEQHVLDVYTFSIGHGI